MANPNYIWIIRIDQSWDSEYFYFTDRAAALTAVDELIKLCENQQFVVRERDVRETEDEDSIFVHMTLRDEPFERTILFNRHQTGVRDHSEVWRYSE